MSPEESQSDKSRIFYGWFALAGVAIVIFIVGGAFVHSFGVLLPELIDEYEWSRAEISLALTLGILAFGLPSPLFGILVNKYGPKYTIVVGNAIAALGLAGVFLAQEVWHLYFFYIITGVGGGFGGYIASTAVVNNWFIRRRSLALGIFQSFAGLGGFVFPPVTTALIAALDWRVSWLVLAGLILVVPVFIGGAFLIRNKPEDMGLLPDGMASDAFLEYEKTQSHSSVRRTFWLGIFKGFKDKHSLVFRRVGRRQFLYVGDTGNASDSLPSGHRFFTDDVGINGKRNVGIQSNRQLGNRISGFEIQREIPGFGGIHHSADSPYDTADYPGTGFNLCFCDIAGTQRRFSDGSPADVRGVVLSEGTLCPGAGCGLSFPGGIQRPSGDHRRACL